MEIKVVSEAEFDGLYGIIEESFPYEERRDREDERREIKRKEFNFCRLVSGKETVGIAAYWSLKKYIFLEHLAIKKSERGKGYGAVFLNKLGELSDKPIILEVEPPEKSEVARKRIGFYERNGYILNEKKDYEQPSYHGGKGVHLLLMSSAPMSEEETARATREIREICYKIH